MLVPSSLETWDKDLALQVCDLARIFGAAVVTGLLGAGVEDRDDEEDEEEEVTCSQCVSPSTFSTPEKSSFESKRLSGAGRFEAFLMYSPFTCENISGPSFFAVAAFLGANHIPALGAVRDAEVEVV